MCYAARVSVSLLLFSVSIMAGAQVPLQRQKDLLYLLHQDCGACHGMRLLGGLGPSLQPEALKNKPVAYLAATILEGRPGTPMPPWRPFMTPEEAAWLAARLKEGAVQ